MKKFIITIAAALSLISCSKKPKDFVGVYNFQVMDAYFAKDTSEYTMKYFRKEPIKIKVNKLVPMKIDIFKNGEQLNGTFLITTYQQSYGLDLIDKKTENRADLKNIHLINDTLIAEVGTTKKTLQIKIVKSGSDSWLILKASTSKDIEKEECNKLATISEGNIVYKSLNGASNEVELINESNACEVEKSVKFCLDNGYKKEKESYLSKLLTNFSGK